ncbi:MAG TPA: hypothetical protein VFE31_03590 [Opitutaceae bacterium]|jgi:hypothetical protein|nr:hypothetical protein [Opitutaceae bacterium]
MDWVFAAIGGLIGTGALYVLLDVPIVAQAARSSGGSALIVTWEGSQPEPAVAQEARLMDPSTLFLPSPLTAATRTSPKSGLAVAYSRLAWREAPELAFHATDLQLNLPPPMPVPNGPAAALQIHPPGNPALGLGRRDVAPVVLPKRAGWMEVVDMLTGKVVISEPLPRQFPDSSEAAGAVRPDIYFVTVGADGVLGDPVPAAVGTLGTGTGYLRTPSSEASAGTSAPGVERESGDVVSFEKQLDARLSFDHRLGAGFYRISVGP